MAQIVTWHEYPPIPDRRWDWGAHGDSYEPGSELAVGWGPTKEAAVKDYLTEVDDAELEEIRYSMVTHGDSAEWLPLVLVEQATRKEDVA